MSRGRTSRSSSSSAFRSVLYVCGAWGRLGTGGNVRVNEWERLLRRGLATGGKDTECERLARRDDTDEVNDGGVHL
jgi:hypothetical protein